jgi:hypothetical protein
MNTYRQFALSIMICFVLSRAAGAYEIGNHASMSQEALEKSKLNTDIGFSGKLSRLGLKQLALFDTKQLFPRVDLPNAAPRKDCYGFRVVNPTEPEANWVYSKEESAAEPPELNDAAPANKAKYTLIDLIRLGACYEDNNEFGGYRSLAHFYDPQTGVLSAPGGNQSPDWALSGNGGSATGANHFSYQDARNYFHLALTSNTKALRDKNWGLTFQSLGHVIHHLQDMASPQHVRGELHCDARLCQFLGQYNPSAYEKGYGQRLAFIRNLAASATTPILFGLPREFWSTGPTVSGYQNLDQGIAAYSSTHYVSSRTDFLTTAVGAVVANTTRFGGHALPTPQPTPFEQVSFATLKPGVSLPAGVCADATKCYIDFYGSTAKPNTRISSRSIFNQDLSGAGDRNTFTQNQFTYDAAASDLVPLATRYSAGLIDYFFRGEMEIKLPADGFYSVIDGGDPASNCKDSCGFKKIKVIVKNTTAAINGVAQDFVGGTTTAIVKFSRNSCYMPDLSGEVSTVLPYNADCFLVNGEPQEEQVVADALPAPFSLAVGEEKALTLTFATPIPVNAWNVKLQFIYKGKVGLEEDSVAVHTHRISAPTPTRFLNDTDYLLINQKYYTRSEVEANQALLSVVSPFTCAPGAPGSKILVSTCFQPATFRANLQTADGNTTISTQNTLPAGQHVLWLFLGEINVPINHRVVYLNNGGYANRALDPRKSEFNEATGIADITPLRSIRGLQATSHGRLPHYASVDTTPPTLEELNSKPPYATTTPVKATSFNF